MNGSVKKKRTHDEIDRSQELKADVRGMVTQLRTLVGLSNALYMQMNHTSHVYSRLEGDG